MLPVEDFSLNRMTLAEQVASKIESIVLEDVDKFAGKLPSEQALATTFSVSRTVIREALVILRAKGLILKTNGTNTQICRQPTKALENSLKLMIQLQDIKTKEINEVRCALEIMAVQLAAANPSSDDIQQLEQLVDEIENCQDDYARRTEFDLKFHHKLAEMSGNALLLGLSNVLFSLLTPLIYDMLQKHGVTEDSYRLHKKIVEAIKNSNPDEATDIMRIHLAISIRNQES